MDNNGAQREKIYQALIHTQYLLVGSIDCWLGSFHGICEQKEKYRISPELQNGCVWSQIFLGGASSGFYWYCILHIGFRSLS